MEETKKPIPETMGEKYEQQNTCDMIENKQNRLAKIEIYSKAGRYVEKETRRNVEYQRYWTLFSK